VQILFALLKSVLITEPARLSENLQWPDFAQTGWGKLISLSKPPIWI